jgi:hypothetical protein
MKADLKTNHFALGYEQGTGRTNYRDDFVKKEAVPLGVV